MSPSIATSPAVACRRGRAARALIIVIALLLGAPLLAQQGQAPAADGAFRIGVGDVLTVFIYGESREQVTVRPDGMITLPLAGDIRAAGLTPMELAGAVKTSLAPLREVPTVNVAVQEIHSYRIYLLGKVGSQQMIESSTPLSLLQALSIAGGLNEFASKKILVLRESGGVRERLEMDFDRIIKGKAPGQNIRLLSGDVVVAL